MDKQGKIAVVGIGPGHIDHLTPAARKTIEDSEIIIGYAPYLKLIGALIADKPTVATGMRGEMQRISRAIEEARRGHSIAVVSSGDAGVYGMAGLLLQMLPNDSGIDICIIPGITAANASGALLGAPLTHDWVSISLSDLLTPVALIEKRLGMAAEGDFVTVLYNPRSQRRKVLFQKAMQIFRAQRTPETPVGIVRNAFRDEQKVVLSTLHTVDRETAWIDMFCTVIIGNSQSYIREGRIITPRGYPIDRERHHESES